MTACSICPRALPDDAGGYACQRCTHRMRYALNTLADRELPLLRQALVPGSSGPPTGTRFGGLAHAPLPADGRVLDLLGPGSVRSAPYSTQAGDIPLLPLLRYWADRLAMAFPARHVRSGTQYLEPYGGADQAVSRRGTDIAAWSRWLVRYLPYAADLYWVRELHDALDDMLHRVRAITGTQPHTHHRLAPCPACDAFAVVHTDGEWDVKCEACGQKTDPDEYAAHAAAVMPEITAAATVMPELAAMAIRQAPALETHRNLTES
jgi:ribosomal protein S27E